MVPLDYVLAVAVLTAATCDKPMPAPADWSPCRRCAPWPPRGSCSTRARGLRPFRERRLRRRPRLPPPALRQPCRRPAAVRLPGKLPQTGGVGVT